MEPNAILSGRLEDLHFPDLLLEISQRRETGILFLVRQQIEKEIYIQDGRIVFAKSNDPDQRLGELLLRRGKVTLRQLKDAAARIGPGVRLGTILVQEGHMKAADLYQGVIDQVEEIVYSVFEWSEGEYTFHPGELPGKEVITLSISMPDIINAGIARIWRWSWISKGVGSLDTMYTRRKEWNSIARKMLITPAVESILEMLEQPMSLEQVLDRSRRNSYETAKILWALLSTGIIEKIPRLELFPDAAGESATQPESVLAVVEEAQAAVGNTPEPAEPAPATVETVPATMDPAPAAVATPDASQPAPAPSGLPAAIEHASTEVIPWQPRRLPPAPPPSPPVLAPGLQNSPVLSDTADEPYVAPTVEISFSDLAEVSDLIPEAAQPPTRPLEVSAAELQRSIANFNQKHRYLYEMLRMEMGTGAGNFVGKILKKAAEAHPLIFEGIRMNEFGELNAEALGASIQGNLVDDFGSALQWLIDQERSTAAAFIDRKRLELIDAGLLKIQEKQRKEKN